MNPDGLVKILFVADLIENPEGDQDAGCYPDCESKYIDKSIGFLPDGVSYRNSQIADKLRTGVQFILTIYNISAKEGVLIQQSDLKGRSINDLSLLYELLLNVSSFKIQLISICHIDYGYIQKLSQIGHNIRIYIVDIVVWSMVSIVSESFLITT